MLPRLSGVIVPQRQNPALLRLVSLRWLGMVVALGVPRLTPRGAWLPLHQRPLWLLLCPGFASKEQRCCPFWDEVTRPIRGDNLTSEVAVTSSPSQAGVVGARVLSHRRGQR